MEKQILIAIGREYGSGGHEIGKKLASRLNIDFFDRNMLDHMFRDDAGMKKQMERYDEDTAKPFIHRHVRGYTNSIEENLARMQFEFIHKQAEEGKSFVVVGRSGEAVLRDFDCEISVFIRGDMYSRIRRVMECYDLNEKDAIDKITRHDRNRKRYHNTYADCKWGDSRGYDLCINSSKLGVDGVVDMLFDYVKRIGDKERS